MTAEFKESIGELFPGMDATGCARAITAFAQETIPHGRAVSLSPAGSGSLNNDGARLAIAGDIAAEILMGIAAKDNFAETNSTGIEAECSFPVLHDGKVIVETIDSAARGGDVYVVVDVGANQGKFSSVIGVTNELLPGAKFLEDRATPGTVKIHLPEFIG